MYRYITEDLFLKRVNRCPRCDSKTKKITKKKDRYREFKCSRCGNTWSGVRI